jgi:chloride channel protein, CIC family
MEKSRRPVRYIVEKLKLQEGTFLILSGIIIGILAGTAFLFLHWLIDYFSYFLLGESSWNSIEGYKRLPFHFKLLLPLSGVFLSGFIIRYLSKGSGDAGVGLLLKYIKLKNGIIPPSIIIFKIITSALSVATGIPLGTQGPVIMISSAIGSSVGQFFKVSISKTKLFLGCGAAAGLSVAFNAPIAGTIFAVETILGNFAIKTLTPIVVAAATASLFGSYFMPEYRLLPEEVIGLSSQISSFTEIILFTIFGIINAFLGLGLIKMTYYNSNLFDKIKKRLPEYIHTPLIILPFALTVPFVPEIFGLGKDIMIAGHSFSPQFLIMIALLKLFFLSIVSASGASGGIFFPILFAGYVFGLGFGKIVPMIFTDIDPEIGRSFAVVGVGALLGAATQEPISSLIIVFELTRDYNMMPSLMLATVTAVFISKSLSPFSIYNYQLVREGVPLEENEESSLMKENHVELCMMEKCVRVKMDEKLKDIIDRMKNMERFESYVVDDEGNYIGAINGVFGTDGVLKDNPAGEIALAADVVDTTFPVVYPDTPLSEAMGLMISRTVIELPVLDRNGKLLGCIHEHDIIDFYHREIISKSSLLKTVNRIEGASRQHIELGGDYKIEAIQTPSSMWGKSLLKLKLREKYSIVVLAVQERGSQKSTISPERPFEPGDVLIVAGTQENIEIFKRSEK